MQKGRQDEGLSIRDNLDRAASEYAIAWMNSGAEARDSLRNDLVRRLIPFADRLAYRYRARVEPLDDIRQVARLGLIKAVDRYNPERGSFTAFASVTISGEVKRHFRDHTWGVHVERRLQNLMLEMGEATAELTQLLARTPTVAELARHLDVNEHDVHSTRMCTAVRRQVSLSTPLAEDGTKELGDLLGHADANLESIADRLAIKELLRELPPPIRRIIILRFYGNRTQSQIADDIGISQMHVSRLLRRGLAWLRAALLNDAPPPWSRLHDYYEPETMTVQLRQTELSLEVQVDGQIDAQTADRLSRRLHSAVSLAAPYGRITVDLTCATFTDDIGVAVLGDAMMAAVGSEVAMTIVGLPEHMGSILADKEASTPQNQDEQSGPASH
jgi:RNA polymerase sigma-B factor